jgi:hypothetical protein
MNHQAFRHRPISRSDGVQDRIATNYPCASRFLLKTLPERTILIMSGDIAPSDSIGAHGAGDITPSKRIANQRFPGCWRPMASAPPRCTPSQAARTSVRVAAFFGEPRSALNISVRPNRSVLARMTE